ncbi:MAG: hypothetical protein JNK00_13395 [Flavipsychrobacter sp.]|nr:hypothetical protein [Flavipsychrobacter sp.]
MLFIILTVLFSYRNTILANKKGQNAMVWTIITIASLFLSAFIGTLIILLFIYKGAFNPLEFSKFLDTNIPAMLTLHLIAAGGGLATGYILERMPDRKQ